MIRSVDIWRAYELHNTRIISIFKFLTQIQFSTINLIKVKKLILLCNPIRKGKALVFKYISSYKKRKRMKNRDLCPKAMEIVWPQGLIDHNARERLSKHTVGR